MQTVMMIVVWDPFVESMEAPLYCSGMTVLHHLYTLVHLKLTPV
jgi:hypothetical protein